MEVSRLHQAALPKDHPICIEKQNVATTKQLGKNQEIVVAITEIIVSQLPFQFP
jgi:hypothetical protein